MTRQGWQRWIATSKSRFIIIGGGLIFGGAMTVVMGAIYLIAHLLTPSAVVPVSPGTALTLTAILFAAGLVFGWRLWHVRTGPRAAFSNDNRPPLGVWLLRQMRNLFLWVAAALILITLVNTLRGA